MFINIIYLYINNVNYKLNFVQLKEKVCLDMYV